MVTGQNGLGSRAAGEQTKEQSRFQLLEKYEVYGMCHWLKNPATPLLQPQNNMITAQLAPHENPGGPGMVKAQSA
jgi:hypothetical protein